MHSYYNKKDTDFDFAGVDAAAEYIGLNLRKWGRVDVRQYKEKFGTVRVYCSLGIYMWHQLFWPGYVCNQYPYKWIWVADVYFPKWVFHLINKVLLPYHRWLYRLLYQRAIVKWPHLREEILCSADWPEVFKGD